MQAAGYKMHPKEIESSLIAGSPLNHVSWILKLVSWPNGPTLRLVSLA